MTYDVITRARRTTRRWLTAVCLATAALAGAVTVAVVGAGPDRSVTSPAGPTPIHFDVGPADGSRADLPSDLSWADVAGVSVPVSGQSGPRFSSGGQALGFAHDRAGAVLAAVHI
ncbi:hypothetical protein AB0873_28605, partial [Micromonospora sp. NPDC047707]